MLPTTGILAEHSHLAWQGHDRATTGLLPCVRLSLLSSHDVHDEACLLPYQLYLTSKRMLSMDCTLDPRHNPGDGRRERRRGRQLAEAKQYFSYYRIPPYPVLGAVSSVPLALRFAGAEASSAPEPLRHLCRALETFDCLSTHLIARETAFGIVSQPWGRPDMSPGSPSSLGAGMSGRCDERFQICRGVAGRCRRHRITLRGGLTCSKTAWKQPSLATEATAKSQTESPRIGIRESLITRRELSYAPLPDKGSKVA